MSGVSTRAARAEVALRLRAQGLTAREIGERLGISRSYASALFTDPEGEKYLRRRAGYGRCEICGTPTNGSNGREEHPRCAAHNRGAEIQRALAGTRGFTHDVLVLIGDGLDRYGDLRDGLGISSNYASVMLNRLVRGGFIERVSRGRYRLTLKGQKVTAGA